MSHVSCIPQLVCHDLLHSVVMLHKLHGAVWCTSATVHIHCCCGVLCGVLCGVYRFVQFADSGYEADPDIDRIEQQVSLRGITSATRAQPFLYIRPHTS